MTKKKRKKLDRINDEYSSVKELKEERGRWAVVILMVVPAIFVGLTFFSR